jgi:hypothetical protein
VLDRQLPVSIGCSKSFRQTNALFYPEGLSDGEVKKWLVELAGELYTRVSTDSERNARVPKQLTVNFSMLQISASKAKGQGQGGKIPPHQKQLNQDASPGKFLSPGR